ncbi:3-hydroxybutyrate dehydrogenase [Hydrogenophaga sp. SNF1]|uniref:3-hydroxybutyrate dehydrogenase n=1 Tax=Hydrogenophaga sp. SNF1 TaxID=3098762 RepID=UPI002ACC1B8A|nr:3-hydroxybutyrate dehydrogenase [Hydrogenophaga sp. SNF1]WQB84960.1 3-hydroxybutyrate dehydrogenase [Hydrogenophaga sp. SNF1]
MSAGERVALVTGSTSGIGLAIARRLAREGFRIALHGFAPPEGVAAIEEALRKLGAPQARHFEADLLQPAQIERLMAAVAQDHGRLDVLVNNAGIQHVAPIDQFPPERWDAILAVNLSAAFHTTRLALPLMRARGWGRIVNIASVSGLVAAPMKAAYVAAKHGLVGLTKVTALETATEAITCNAICPGWVLTSLVERQLQARHAAEGGSREDVVRQLLVKQPSQDFVTLEQVAALAAYFVSDEAAQTRGAAWNLDGGYAAA